MDSLSDFDGFSWRRVAMTGRYFLPTIRGKVIALSALSFIFMSLACLSGLAEGNPVSSGLISVISIAMVMTPILFTVRPADEIFCSIPALAAEKRTFIFLFTFLIMPALLTLPGSILAEIVCPGAEKYMLGANATLILNSDVGGIFLTEALISTAAQISVGLWAAFALRGHRRTAWTTMAIIGSIFLNGFIGFILGFVSAVLSGGKGSIGNTVTESLTVFGPYIIAFWSIILIFAVYKASRAISRKQV